MGRSSHFLKKIFGGTVVPSIVIRKIFLVCLFAVASKIGAMAVAGMSAVPEDTLTFPPVKR
jgi:hypothetical protein